jgi:hypothetical protein
LLELAACGFNLALRKQLAALVEQGFCRGLLLRIRLRLRGPRCGEHQQQRHERDAV